MDDVHGVQGLQGKHQVGHVDAGILFLEVDFVLDESAEGAATAEVEDEEVEVVLLEGIVEIHVVDPSDASVDLLLLLEGLHPILIQILDLHHLHGEQILRLPLPHQEHLTI